MTKTKYTAKVIANTKDMTEVEWLSLRRRGIGGSEAGTIMGVNEYKTPRELFYEKTGVEPVNSEPKDFQLPLAWGHALEEVVAQAFSYKTGLRVYEKKEMYQHSLYPFMQANVDRFIELPNGTIGILECKTANPNAKFKWEDGGIPFSYECQVRHYMAVMNMDTAYIACLFDNSIDTMVIRRIDRDYDFEQALIEAEQIFWEEFVQNGKEPPLSGDPYKDIALMEKHIALQMGSKPVALTGFDTEFVEIAKLREKKKALEEDTKGLETQIKCREAKLIEALGTETVGSATVDGMVYTISHKPSIRTSINKEALEKMAIHDKDIYDKYVSETTSYRTTFSAKKEKK